MVESASRITHIGRPDGCIGAVATGAAGFAASGSAGLLQEAARRRVTLANAAAMRASVPDRVLGTRPPSVSPLLGGRTVMHELTKKLALSPAFEMAVWRSTSATQSSP